MKGGQATQKGARPCKRVLGTWMHGEEGQGCIRMALAAGEGLAGCRGGIGRMQGWDWQRVGTEDMWVTITVERATQAKGWGSNIMQHSQGAW